MDQCSCPALFKNYTCKHLVGIAIRLKYAAKQVSIEAKNIPLGHNRLPGRPALAEKALQHQSHTLYSILTKYEVNGESNSLEVLIGEEITVEFNTGQKPTHIPG